LSGNLVAADESSSYQGRQSGWYAQAVYQFIPRWRVGLRYDALDSSASGSDAELIEEAGLDNEGHKPRRFSLMTDWSNSEFSRFRLQYNRDESSQVVDDQWILQYLLGLGAHGAHNY
jgi:outer membrane receptor protein involved in Fe transport